MYSLEGGGDKTLFNKATTSAVWFMLSRSFHENFGTRYWVFGEFPDPSSPEPSTLMTDTEAATTINAYLLSFLDKFVKEKDDHLLDGRSTKFPRVIGFQKK